MRKILPNFIVAGSQRCGTTYLYELLKQHPEIYMPKIKELHFFDQQMEKNTGENIDEYAENFKNVKAETAIGEITPSYIYADGVPELIFKKIGEIKLIFLFRNPVDRAYSHYWFNLSEGRECYTFERALEKEQERISKGSLNRLFFSYVERGYYMNHINRFLKHFPRENVLSIISENFFPQPDEYLKQICRFLGVNDSFKFHFNVNRNRRELPRYISLYRNLIKIEKLLPNPKKMRRIIKNIKKCRDSVPMVDQSYPKMNKNTRTKLMDLFKTHNVMLGDFLEVDLGIWK